MTTVKLYSIAQSLPSGYNDAEVGLLFEFYNPPLNTTLRGNISPVDHVCKPLSTKWECSSTLYLNENTLNANYQIIVGD